MQAHTVLVAGLALAATAPGQQINIDIGSAAGTPSAAYGSHAGSPGVWNAVPHDAVDFPLVDVNGAATAATITISGGSAFAFDHPGTSGDDQALMDDGTRSAGVQTVTITNAFAGNFYAYAWSPDSAATFTNVSVPLLGGPGADLGGTWPGGQAWQTTYELFDNCDFGLVDLVIEIAPAAGSAFGTLNGLQINGAGGGACLFCSGVGDACPCDNPGLPSAGCDNAQGTGGVRLRVLSQSFSPNAATLRGEGFPPGASPTALVIRAPGIAGSQAPFGDGLLCLDTSAGLVRLAATTAVGGLSTHVFGHGAAAGTGAFSYQLWYRNTPASFCTADAFNTSSLEWLLW
jgi:hypothetical protein